MAPRGVKISEKQRIMLLEFFEGHPEIVSGRLTAQFTKVAQDKLWTDLMNLLHTDGLGAIKDVKKWKKSWADWKSETKAKAASIKNSINATGGGKKSPLELTEIEKRLLGIIGEMCVEGNAAVAELGFNVQQQEPQLAGPSNFDSNINVAQEVGQSFAEAVTQAGTFFFQTCDHNLSSEMTMVNEIIPNSSPTVGIGVSCVSGNKDDKTAQEHPGEAEDINGSASKCRKRKRNVRTEATENYEKATETLKEMEHDKNAIKNEKNKILKGIQRAMEERNEIERVKANAMEKFASAFQDISQVFQGGMNLINKNL